jgi:16S rRNA (guanine1207-N2)-methyltransferase
MSEHYYTSSPQVKSREERIEITLRGMKLTFYTDRGVFSKEKVDFGSELLIDVIEANEDAKILDVGCGYGPIGLSLAKESSKRSITMVDVNQRALTLAGKNAKVNGIENISIQESDLLVNVEDRDFDLIISNPPIRAGKDVVHTLFEQSYDHLKPEGELWIVIQKKQGSPSAIKKLESLFEIVEEVTKKKGYRIIRAKK